MQEIHSGLYYCASAISEQYANQLREWLISSNDWRHVGGPKSRVVLQYGKRYNYDMNRVDSVDRVNRAVEPNPIPEILNPLLETLRGYYADIGISADTIFNQCIINKYEPGQGIAKHIDNLHFGPAIACFTLGNRYMRFAHNNKNIKNTKDIWDIYTEDRSLYVQTGDARYKYTHEMQARKNDRVNNIKIPRGTVYSFTFRIA